MKRVQFPGGITKIERSMVGLARQVRVDTQLNTLRVHNGVTPGGSVLATESMVYRAVAESAGNLSGTVGIRYVSSEADLIDLVPETGVIVALREAGQEGFFVWDSGTNPGSGISSSVAGFWKRFNSQTNLFIQMAMHGVIHMQYNGTAPATDQDITAWLTGGEIKLWDGANYLAVTPELFARLLSKIGDYAGSISLPGRVGDTLLEVADLNAVTDTGWYKSAVADANAPVATASFVLHAKLTADSMMQIFYLQGSTNRDSYKRYKVGGVWGSWVLVPGTYPNRLAGTSGAIADCNTATDSGFYSVDAASANAPTTGVATLTVVRRSSTAITQLWVGQDANTIYARRYVSGVWQSWIQVYPADGGAITGTVARANVGILTIDQAEAEAGTATTDRIWTAERVRQAILGFFASAANFLANVDGILGVNNVWSAAIPVNAGNWSGNVTLDLATFINRYAVATGNITFFAISSPKNQSGLLRVTASGSNRTVSFNTAAFATPNNAALPTIASGTTRLYSYAYDSVLGKCIIVDMGTVS